MEYKHNCPVCGKMQEYAFSAAFYRAVKGNKLCKSCCRKGRTFSDEAKQKMRERKVGIVQPITARLNNSISQKRRYLNPDVRRKLSDSIKKALHRPDVRKRHIEAMVRTKWLIVKMDLGQEELLEKWNRLGFHLEPNYQLHTDDFLCYLDGYDKEHNVVLEYDSKYHNKLSWKKRDLERQKKIIDILQPNKFWRYDAVNKTMKNILEGQYDGNKH